MKKTCLMLLAAITIAGCSHYTTNSKEIRFESVNLHIRPSIPIIGDEQPQEKFSYLGWIDAHVQKPSTLQPDPTEAQVNYVLAHLAKERGADAVIHVTYKQSIGMTGLTRLEARGQAIRFEKVDDNKTPVAQFQSVRSTTTAPVSDQKTLNEKLNELTAPTAVQEPIHTQDPLVDIDNSAPMFVTITPEKQQAAEIEKLPVFNHLDQPATKKERPAPIGSTPTAKITPEASHFSYNQSRRDRMAEQRERVDLMLNNARFLESKAKAAGDREMLNAALRLIQMLESQKRFFVEQENAQ